MKTVAVSGYFNPIHVGHVEYLEEAKKLGDILVVIVNNDKQVKLKGSISFMNEEERIKIIDALRCVDKAFLSIDEDETVCKTLEFIKPDIFAKGGDRDISNIPEREVCKKLGIKIIDNVGGKKIQSSSKLIKKARKQK